ncbi:DUF401 family protein [Sutterella massiliensis]|uniref:DUF401 family protein n=1 Tax=Sutterella massiliensis TaxID=1816689 RepID=A0ABS2DQZ1_9BURK|nr:DUF401 family protein [Sutterella massiliensis]MBM6703732.1 DUF401 family protein [Sutterella massiliensis]
MNIFLVILLAAIAIVTLLRYKLPIGVAILSGGLVMWLCLDRTLASLVESAVMTVEQSRTYDLLFSLYFVMCLEIELRRSGTLDGMVKALNRLFKSTRVTLATMPAFLGFLPSLGGARFSAPIVEAASAKMNLKPETKAAINFWFRHIFEVSSPTIPGMILACAIAGIHVSDLVLHLLWFSVAAFVIGWLVLLAPLKKHDHISSEPVSIEAKLQNIFDVVLAIAPVVVNLLLMIVFDISAAISMGIVTAAMIPILRLCGRRANLREILLGALDYKLLGNVCLILYFIGLLTTTGALEQIVAIMTSSAIPTPVVFAILSFIIGMLTGMSQGYISMVMPIAASISFGSIDYAGLAMVFGCAGQMITPVHLCFTISVDYFKANFFKTLKPVLLIEVPLIALFSIVTYFTWVG